uniref:Uncharacterized protein n=1 Tax=Mycena chlorophos TaxID=658473 RepID=A0ABQ0LB79_MYCCL|nr:predicted protein [Mycena chlorophos]
MLDHPSMYWCGSSACSLFCSYPSTLPAFVYFTDITPRHDHPYVPQSPPAILVYNNPNAIRHFILHFHPSALFSSLTFVTSWRTSGESRLLSSRRDCATDYDFVCLAGIDFQESEEVGFLICAYALAEFGYATEKQSYTAISDARIAAVELLHESCRIPRILEHLRLRSRPSRLCSKGNLMSPWAAPRRATSSRSAAAINYSAGINKSTIFFAATELTVCCQPSDYTAGVFTDIALRPNQQRFEGTARRFALQALLDDGWRVK